MIKLLYEDIIDVSELKFEANTIFKIILSLIMIYCLKTMGENT